MGLLLLPSTLLYLSAQSANPLSELCVPSEETLRPQTKVHQVGCPCTTWAHPMVEGILRNAPVNCCKLFPQMAKRKLKLKLTVNVAKF